MITTPDELPRATVDDISTRNAERGTQNAAPAVVVEHLVRRFGGRVGLQVVGLDERRWRDVSSFSPGERRRLALASALVHEPDVLLLDDPLRGLDGFARLEQIEVLRELHRLGSTMLLAATRPEDVLEVCDNFAVIRDGGLGWSGDGTAAAALAAPQFADS